MEETCLYLKTMQRPAVCSACNILLGDDMKKENYLCPIIINVILIKQDKFNWPICMRDTAVCVIQYYVVD
jgi:hypothetical protein